MDHPHSGLHYTPSDLHLFGRLKKHLSGKEFVADASCKQAVTSWLEIFDTDFFYAWIEAFVP
jgi:hypothetical protein